MKIFLSAVSSEFLGCRNALASDLRAIGCEIRVQEDFQQGPRTLIEKLEDYIANCDRVIMLVGRVYGFEAASDKVARRDPPRSYTQWEYYFALGERLNGTLVGAKELYLYLASDNFLALTTSAQSEEHARRQQEFISHIKASGKDRSVFDSLDHLCRLVLRDGWQMSDRPRRQRPPFQLPKRALAGELFGRATLLTRLIGRLRRREHVDIWGPAGMGKTALAAEAICEVVGNDPNKLNETPFPDGVVLLDLYAIKSTADPAPAWTYLANAFDAALPTTLPVRERAVTACSGRRALVVIEGAEEAGSGDELQNILEVLSLETTRLVLTRYKSQVNPATAFSVDAALERDDSLNLLRQLCAFTADEATISSVYEALGGHPLALTWAGSQLTAADEPPDIFVAALKSDKLPNVHQPGYESRTLRWLYDRSVKHLTADARRVLSAAGFLAQQPFPLGAATAAVNDIEARNALALLVRHGLLRLSDDKTQWQFTHALAHHYSATHADAALLGPLGHWAVEEFDVAVARTKTSGDFTHLGVILNHGVVLLHADINSRALSTLRSKLTYDGLDALNTLGRLDLIRIAAMASFDWIKNAQDQDQEDTELQRELSVSHTRLGDLLRTTGDLAAACFNFEKSLAIVERLAAADPTNSQSQRDLSISCTRLGDLLSATGDLAAARSNFEKSLAIAERLAAADPTNSQWQRDLSINYNKLGDLLRRTGDLTAARSIYEKSLAIFERLASTDPTDSEWQRDLSISYNKLGDLLRDTGDLTAARSIYEKSLAIFERLADADPTDSEWQRDLSISYNKLGDLLRRTGDLAAARSNLEKSLAIFERLAGADLTNSEWQRDLSISYCRIANWLTQQNQRDEALTYLEKARAISHRLVQLDCRNAIWTKDLAWIEDRLASLKT